MRHSRSPRRVMAGVGSLMLAAIALLPGAAPVLGTTDPCAPGAGQVTVYSMSYYDGNCQKVDFGNYPSVPFTVGSVRIGSPVSKYKAFGTNGTYTFSVRFVRCIGATFGGPCTGSFKDLVALTNVGSFRVQPFRTTNYFPVANISKTDLDGFSYTTRQCTWGAAERLNRAFGFHLSPPDPSNPDVNMDPAWGSDAVAWDTNAASASYLVDQVPAVDTILVVEPGSHRLATGWYYGSKTAHNQFSTTTSSLGHVAWVVEVLTDSSGATWIHTQDTNFNPNHMNAWAYYSDLGVTWVNVYTKLDSGLHFIHPTG